MSKENAGVSDNSDGRLHPEPKCGFRAPDFCYHSVAISLGVLLSLELYFEYRESISTL